MQLHKFKIHWGAICLITVLSLVMYGCGGGGSSSSEPEVDSPPTETPPADDGEGGAGDGDGEPEVSQDDIDAEAMRVAGAIGIGTPMPVIGDALPTNITHTKGAIEIKDEPEDTDLMKSDEMVAAIPKWKSNVYMRAPSEGVEDMIVLYNDVGPHTDESYGTVFDIVGSGEDALVDGVASTDPDTGVLTLATTVGDAIYTVDGFPSGDRQTFEVMDDPKTAADDREKQGTFYGVPGKFTCIATSCSATTDNKGKLVTISEGWTFTPTGNIEDIKVKGVIPDADYMVMGYWLEKTTDTAGKTTYEFSHISDGARAYIGAAIGARDADSGVITGAEAHAVTKTAKYAGPATGMYIMKTLDSLGGAISPFSSGQFVANAMLTANFGGNSVAVTDQFSVSGTVSGFVDAEGAPISEDRWTLKLMKSDISGDGTLGWTFSGDTTGGTSDSGSWAGAFYGPALGDNPATADDVETDFPFQPGAAAGTFNGHFANGHVAGAFGATKQ
ncbi:MAG: hypothetical protein OXC42_07265 [Gammaproteobacteria bacterium]|nr:hypothetical protein [Gammaproteobacteria bacterium]